MVGEFCWRSPSQRLQLRSQLEAEKPSGVSLAPETCGSEADQGLATFFGFGHGGRMNFFLGQPTRNLILRRRTQHPPTNPRSNTGKGELSGDSIPRPLNESAVEHFGFVCITRNQFPHCIHRPGAAPAVNPLPLCFPRNMRAFALGRSWLGVQGSF
jgi:hypothetical protein